MGSRIQYKGYHGTLRSSENDILKNGYHIRAPRESDNHWLGHGVYFFDSYDLALWWAEKKSYSRLRKYHKHDPPVVFEMETAIDRDRVLDLDQEGDLLKFFDYAEAVEKQYVQVGWKIQLESLPEAERDEESKKLRCFLLDCYKQENKTLLVAYTFFKPNPHSGPWHPPDFRCMFPDFVFKERQLCITDPSIITKNRLMNTEGDLV